MLNAIVLIKAESNQVAKLGPALAAIDGVGEVYSVTGEEDLVALLHSNDTEAVATLVTEKIASLPGILDTRTLIAFRQYDPAETGF